jgi:hypothetical protein
MQDEVKERATKYAGREPIAYMVIEAVDRDPMSKEEAEEAKMGRRPVKAQFRFHFSPKANAADIQQLCIAIVHASRLAILAAAKIVDEETQGKVSQGQVVKVAYDEGRKLFEGHPDAKFISELTAKPQPRKREPEEPFDKKKGIVP